jgi:hypothetical protein
LPKSAFLATLTAQLQQTNLDQAFDFIDQKRKKRRAASHALFMPNQSAAPMSLYANTLSTS